MKRQPQVNDRVYWDGDVCNLPRDGTVTALRGHHIRIAWDEDDAPDGMPFGESMVPASILAGPRWGWIDDRERLRSERLAEFERRYGHLAH